MVDGGSRRREASLVIANSLKSSSAFSCSNNSASCTPESINVPSVGVSSRGLNWSSAPEGTRGAGRPASPPRRWRLSRAAVGASVVMVVMVMVVVVEVRRRKESSQRRIEKHSEPARRRKQFDVSRESKSTSERRLVESCES